MATTQDTFTQYTTLGYHGALNTDFAWWADSPHAEGGSIGFGVAVQYGTADDQAIVVATGATEGDILGVTLRTQAVENVFSGTEQVSEYAEGKAMSVLKKGRMFVTVSDGSTAGGQVYIVPDTGEIVSSADDGAATPVPNIALPRSRFVRTVAAGETTEIELA